MTKLAYLSKKEDLIIDIKIINVTFVIHLLTEEDLANEILEKTFLSLCDQSIDTIEILIIVSSDISQHARGTLSDLVISMHLKYKLSISIINNKPAIDDSIQILDSIRGDFVCFLRPGCIAKPMFAEKCVWFLDSRPYLYFCNTISYCTGDTGQQIDGDLAAGANYCRRFPCGSGGIFTRKDIVQRAVLGGWAIGASPSLLMFFTFVARSGSWGETLKEALLLEPVASTSSHLADDENYKIEICTPQPPYTEPYSSLPTYSPIGAASTPRKETRSPILIITSWLTTGGADKFNLDLVKTLHSKGHRIVVCTTLAGDHSWEPRFAEFTDDIFVLSRLLPVKDFPRFLSYIIHSRNIETVLISGSTIGYQFLPYLRSMSPKTKFLDLSHVEEPHWQNGGYPRFALGYSDVLDLNIVSTEHLRSWMVERGADPNRIRVLYTGVEEHEGSTVALRRTEIRSELDIPDTTPVIIFGGRICAQKRPLVLADILNLVMHQHENVRVLIVGTGDLSPAFEEALRTHGILNRVTLMGGVDHQRWIDLLYASDIFVLPSEYEGISIALLEAMSIGVVPVVSEVGGQSEIVNKDSGFLIPHSENEIELYSKSISTLIMDPVFRARMSNSAKSVISSTFSKTVMAKDLERILNDASALSFSAPRTNISQRFGIETATAALELIRLNAAYSWLAGSSNGTAQNEDAIKVINLLLKFRQSWLGKFVAGNKSIRRILNKILALGRTN